MAVGVSPQRLREVRFAEQWRGYRTDEVDEFVEQVAEAFDHLEQRLGEAAERAARAERRLLERGSDDDVGRALVLAQRTADATLHDAEVQAARLIADAEQRAQAMLTEAEEGVARYEAERDARARGELHDLSQRRAVLESDVARLADYVGRQRKVLAEELRAHLAWLESGPDLEAPPRLSAASEPGAAVAGPGAFPTGDRAVEREDAAVMVERTDRGSSLDHSADAVPVEGAVAAPFPDDDVGPRVDDVLAVDVPADDVPADDVPAGDVAGGGSAPSVSGGAPGGVDDDPFIAELRRAVEDPEPLGPREDADDWAGDNELYGSGEGSPPRFRRRRQR